MDLKFLYLVLVFISSVEFVIYYEFTLNKTNKNFIVLYITTLVANFGYAQSIYSTTLEGAFAGMLVSYIGSIFTALFVMIVVVYLCNRRFLLPLRIFLILCAFAIIICIGTTIETNLFFSNQKLTYKYGLAILEWDNGPVMYAYIGYLAVINIGSIWIVIDTIIKKKKVSKSTLFIILLLLLIGTLSYLIPLLLKSKINLYAFAYVLMESVCLFIAVRSNMYDLSSNLMSVFKERAGYGYIAFDRKKRLLGCDDFAIQIFPELENEIIDTQLRRESKELRRLIDYDETDGKWADNLELDFPIKKDGMAFICRIHPITYKNKHLIGYLFELRDDTKQQNYINGINLYNQALSQDVANKTKQITDMQDSIIKGMAMMVESRDNSTGGHIARTSDCVRIFMDKLLEHDEFSWCTKSFCENVIKAAPMHDLGKIAVDDSILRKPGKFTPEEYEQMKTHAQKGSIIVGEVLKESTDKNFRQIAINLAHYHHEKWNGEGYPMHLKQKEIPVEARIMAFADVFDAIVSQRCYKEAKSFDEAFEIIRSDLGNHFDPEIGPIFLECRPNLEEYYVKALQND